MLFHNRFVLMPYTSFYIFPYPQPYFCSTCQSMLPTSPRAVGTV
jgi:hypothetical protein